MIDTLIAIDWPEASLPLPFVDYSGKPNHAILASGLESAVIQRRLRYSGKPVICSVTWVLSYDQYVRFKAFFRETLNLGISLFKIPLRYPKNSVVTTWICQLGGDLEAQQDSGFWNVSTSLTIIRPAQVSAAARGTGSPFLVLPDANPFIVLVDEAFYVRQPVLSDFTGFLTSDGEPFVDSGGHTLEVLGI